MRLFPIISLGCAALVSLTACSSVGQTVQATTIDSHAIRPVAIHSSDTDFLNALAAQGNASFDYEFSKTSYTASWGLEELLANCDAVVIGSYVEQSDPFLVVGPGEDISTAECFSDCLFTADEKILSFDVKSNSFTNAQSASSAGAGDDWISLRIEGGSIGKVRWSSDLAPTINPGESYLLFLSAPEKGDGVSTEGDYWYLTGGKVGLWKLDESGMYRGGDFDELVTIDDVMRAALKTERAQYGEELSEKGFYADWDELQKQGLVDKESAESYRAREAMQNESYARILTQEDIQSYVSTLEGQQEQEDIAVQQHTL